MRKKSMRATGARVLRDKLERAGVSRFGLEKRLGVARGVAYRWANGTVRPDLTSAILLDRLLGIPIETWADADRLAAFVAE